MTQTYTFSEVSQHNQEKDLWIVIHGGVYNLTNFLKEHPGGEEILINLAGQDATQCFDDIGHSQEAIQLRDTFKIGEVSGGSSATNQEIKSNVTKQNTAETDDDWEYQEPKQETSPWLPIFIGVTAMVYGFIFYTFYF